jgi:hypothetical protein
VQVRRVAPTGRGRSARPTATRPEHGPSELLSLIETMQWDRALAALGRLAPADLATVVVQAEAAAFERVRALPESDVCLSLKAWRVLAALAPSNATYSERVAQAEAALEARRGALLDGLTRDEDRGEPGTVWYNHPWNPRFDDERRPIWLYVGRRADGTPLLRLRTNWLGDSRICVQGMEVVHDGLAETLTRGAYRIDADALGWEWRDEPADAYQIEVLRSITAAGEVELRYAGDPWPCETLLPEEDKDDLGAMLELYDLLLLSAPAPLQAQAA